MKAAVIREYGKIEIEERPVPVPCDDEILVKVLYASICGSDQHIFRGEFHPRTSLPLVPGHEFAGTVAETGKNVRGFQIGEQVTVDPIIPCGKCPACQRKHYPACTSLKLIGIDMDGGFSEYISVPYTLVYRVPGNIPARHAALVELLSIGFHALSRAGVQEDSDVVVWGAGKVGHAILLALSTLKNCRLYVVDILQERLELAEKVIPGVNTVNSVLTDPIEYILEQTGGKGVDIAFEAVGHFRDLKDRYNPVRSCIRSIRGGGKVCVLGLSDDPSPVLFKELIWKEATIISSRVSHGEYTDSISALASGQIQPDGIISSVCALENIQDAFIELENHPEKNLKTLIKISG